MRSAKIVLISPYDSVEVMGLRSISSYLKLRGHDVKLIFLKLESCSFSELYSDLVIGDVIDICRAADIVGISLMTNHFVRVKDLTERIKKILNVPIIWGGIHPTVRPDECLGSADMICVGDGEEAMLELADAIQSGDVTHIHNVWLKKNGSIIKNDVRPLEQDLDKYPFPDYDIGSHYLLENGRVERMTEALLEKNIYQLYGIGRSYHVMTTRHCPYSCAYCVNNAIRKIYTNHKFLLRKRGLEKVLDEIEMVKSKFRFIDTIIISDDTFFIRSLDEIKEFSKEYKKRINLRMFCLLSPLDIDEAKLQCMIEAGLEVVSIGVQAFCNETLLDIYKRPANEEAILKCVRIIEKYESKIIPLYDILVDNPYESDASKYKTVKFVASLAPNAIIILRPLTFYPGTDLYDKAIMDGTIKDIIRDVYLKSWTHNDVRKDDAFTRRLYFQCDIRGRFAAGSILARIIMKYRKSFIVYFIIPLALPFFNKILAIIAPGRRRLGLSRARLKRLIKKFGKKCIL